MIRIPAYIKDLLSLDGALSGAVSEWFQLYEVIFEFSHVPFFGDYTDHGPNHITSVLGGAERLIADPARTKLTSADAAVLALATLLHDAALHITEDGFASLVRDEVRPRSTWFGDKAWSALWHEFLGEAMRWDIRKRIAILGQGDRLVPPSDNPSQFRPVDYQLIGEFLRRHHARLAHEIAVTGFPGLKPAFRPEHRAADPYLDLAGLVARSHGMALRDTFGYLKANYGSVRRYKGVLPIYLMVLLRIADYLEFEAARAPADVLNIKSLRSPISRREWAVHHAIDSVETLHDDPEAIYVHASPSDVDTFLKVEQLLRGLQTELDTSWAVLGEVYGRIIPELGLRLRRVTSNLDDPRQTRKNFHFLPRRVAFRSTGSDLLKLLIAPLYGDNPEIGIRELVQNAVDAVYARRRFEQGKDWLYADPVVGPDVTVAIQPGEDGTWWVVVQDRGIGMDEDVICNYFLTAGASSRTSESWKRYNTNETGRAQIPFTGRFGIGLLAGFILGDEIQVRTRHIDADSEDGFAFSVRVDTEPIDVRREPNLAGTTIRIHVTEKTLSQLLGRSPTRDTSPPVGVWRQDKSMEESQSRWDWYCLRDPQVERRDENGRILPQRWTVPGYDEYPYPGWRRLRHPDYAAIDWTFNPAPALACNGIVIFEQRHDSWDRKDAGIPIPFPNVSVHDPDARLPLTIRRDALVHRRLPFKDALFQSTIDDYLAFCLARAPSAGIADCPDRSWYLQPPYPGFQELDPMNHGMWLSTDLGVVPADRWHLSRLELKTLLVLPLVAGAPSAGVLPLGEQGPILPLSVQSYGFAVSHAMQSLVDPGPLRPGAIGKPFYAKEPLLADYEIVGCQVLFSPRQLGRSFELSWPRQYRTIDKTRIEPTYTLWEWGRCSTSYDIDELGRRIGATAPTVSWPGLVARWTLERVPSPPQEESSVFARRWKEVIRSIAIPFARDRRKKDLREAFDLLEWELRSYDDD